MSLSSIGACHEEYSLLRNRQGKSQRSVLLQVILMWQCLQLAGTDFRTRRHTERERAERKEREKEKAKPKERKAKRESNMERVCIASCPSSEFFSCLTCWSAAPVNVEEDWSDEWWYDWESDWMDDWQYDWYWHSSGDFESEWYDDDGASLVYGVAGSSPSLNQ